jgi:hypothetical protein
MQFYNQIVQKQLCHGRAMVKNSFGILKKNILKTLHKCFINQMNDLVYLTIKKLGSLKIPMFHQPRVTKCQVHWMPCVIIRVDGKFSI